jgi:hypothetical protein
MRTIEALAIQFPDKTGKELMEIQQQDRLKEEQESLEYDKEKAALIKDLNENGAYYRQRLLQNHYAYDHFTNLRIGDSGRIHCDSDTVLCVKRREGGFFFERTIAQNVEMSHYGIDVIKERITKEEWERFIAYIENTFTFWPEKSNS